MRQRYFLAFLLIAITLLLTACSNPTATPQPVATNVPATATNAPTVTTRPTTAAPTATNVPATATATTRPATATPAPTATTAPPTIGKIGETLSGTGFSLTLNNVEKAKQFGQFSKAKDGNVLVALDITIASSKDKGISVNAFNAKISDSSAFAYTASGIGKTPYLLSQNDMPVGEKSRGWWTFEIPETAKGLILEYRTGLPETRVRFDLEQKSEVTPKIPEPSTLKNGAIGETITSEGFIVTVNGVEKAKSYSQFSKAKEGMIFVAVDITVESGKDKGVSVNALSAIIKDTDFYSYSGSAASGKEPSLKSQNDLPKGEKMRGWITFEVPEGATNLLFEYRAGYPEARIRVNLGI